MSYLPKYKVEFELDDCNLSEAGLESFLKHSLPREIGGTPQNPPIYSKVNKLKIKTIRKYMEFKDKDMDLE